MKLFSQTIQRLDLSNKTNEKVKALTCFFDQATDQDKVWALALFTHKRPKKPVNSRQMREWAIELTGLPYWLFEESYQVVGDLSETIALLLPPGRNSKDRSLSYWIHYLIASREVGEFQKKQRIVSAWMELDKHERFIFNKLISGGWRLGVSTNLIIRALSQSTGIEAAVLSHKLMGDWDPETITFNQLIIQNKKEDFLSRPYPFYLAYQLDKDPNELGHPQQWIAEWKWDGIRGQIISRNRHLYVWSRGEDLVNESFPEFQRLVDSLPEGTVIDGEIVVYQHHGIQSFGVLQHRLGRKKVSKKMLQQSPVTMIAYDLLEYNGSDIRSYPLIQRKKWLKEVILKADGKLLHSDSIVFNSWEELAGIRENARDMQAEGIMIKRADSSYKVGRKRGDWWKWKIEPLTVDAVLIYAQKGHGKRADLYTDYTFGVWNEKELIPFAKAYSGLTDKEIREVDRFVKKHTLERFGPVRTVKPELVFEIAFEGIRESKRHKSGLAVRFPRINRWREDKPSNEANTLADLKELLNLYG